MITRAGLVAIGSVILFAFGGCAAQNASSTPTVSTPIGMYRICVDTTGAVSSVDAVQPPNSPALNASLREQLRSLKFRAATKDGVPVTYCMRYQLISRPDGTDVWPSSVAVQPAVAADRASPGR
jgi:hypothetical protein